MSDNRVELKPCPRCGNSDHLFMEPDETGSGGQWVSPIHVGCSQLTGCGLSLARDTEAEAIAAWNTRTLDPSIESLQAEVERLREALRPFGAAAHLFTSAIHNGGLDEVRDFPTPEEWRRVASIYPEFGGISSFPKSKHLRQALAAKEQTRDR